MSKNRYSKMQGNMQYNRPSGGYQKNLYRQQMLANNIKQPKTLDQKTVRNILIAIGAVSVVLLVVLTILLKWKGTLIAVVIFALAMGGFWLYMRNMQNEMIKYYKQVGMTEEWYLKEVSKRSTDVKQVNAARRAWERVKADPIIENPKTNKKKK